MSDSQNDDIVRLFNALHARLDRERATAIALNGEIANCISMQNRIIRDLISTNNRVLALERIIAYRTNREDENDPLNRSDN